MIQDTHHVCQDCLFLVHACGIRGNTAFNNHVESFLSFWALSEQFPRCLVFIVCFVFVGEGPFFLSVSFFLLVLGHFLNVTSLRSGIASPIEWSVKQLYILSSLPYSTRGCNNVAFNVYIYIYAHIHKKSYKLYTFWIRLFDKWIVYNGIRNRRKWREPVLQG